MCAILGALFTGRFSLMTGFAQPPSPNPQAVETLNGTVRQYLMNPDGEVDGLLLVDGSQVNFPPHMSTDLTSAIKPKDTVSVQGQHENAYVFRAFAIANTGTGKSVSESFPPRVSCHSHRKCARQIANRCKQMARLSPYSSRPAGSQAVRCWTTEAFFACPLMWGCN